MTNAKQLEPHQQRVVYEKAELDARHSKLLAFTLSPTFNAVAEDERSRLVEQVEIMGKYSKILGERIAAFNREKQ